MRHNNTMPQIPHSPTSTNPGTPSATANVPAAAPQPGSVAPQSQSQEQQQSASSFYDPNGQQMDMTAVPRVGRADSISFFTNLANGQRFSTDSNSSLSNYLNLPPSGTGPADSSSSSNGNNIVFDNGRGYNLFNTDSFATGANMGSNSNSNSNKNSLSQLFGSISGASSGNNSNSLSNTTGSRRLSDQLELFNPQIRLRAPSFSKRDSIIGFNFNDAGSSDFDFFAKRDSIKNARLPSFLNADGSTSDFDLFSKRESLKNSSTGSNTNGNNDDLLLKETSPSFNDLDNKRQTKSDTDADNINDVQDFREPMLPAATAEQPQPTAQQPPQQQQRPGQQPQLPQQELLMKQQQEEQQQQFQFQQQQQQEEQQQFQFQQQQMQQFQQQQQMQQQHQQLLQQQQQQQEKLPPQQFQPVYRKQMAPTPMPPQLTAPNYQQPLVDPHRRNAAIEDDKSLQPGSSSSSPNGQLLNEYGRPLLGATKVDQLMLVIQARNKGVHDPIARADDGSILDDGINGVLPTPTELVGGIEKPLKSLKSRKTHQCPYCQKNFTQSTHLEVHVRSHIGFKPFACTFCGKRFTQGGNLRTHLRLHTGEKPYNCEDCGRNFSRKGNLEAHRLTHKNLRPYKCKLDGCDKTFTQLGNLKAHQNRFHLETLNRLTQKLAEIDPATAEMSAEERELLEYFASLYKHSNRGIKGRGKRYKAGPSSDASINNNMGNNGITGKDNGISFKDISYK